MPGRYCWSCYYLLSIALFEGGSNVSSFPYNSVLGVDFSSVPVASDATVVSNIRTSSLYVTTVVVHHDWSHRSKTVTHPRPLVPVFEGEMAPYGN